MKHRGVQGTAAIRFLACDACGSEIAGQDEAAANKKAMLAFRKAAEGTGKP